MNVSRIYTRDVVTVSRSTSLKEAARLMATWHIGSLVITDDPPAERRAIGIVTDRDFVIQAVAAGADPSQVTVGHVISPRLASIDENSEAYEALKRMANLGVRRLAVTADGGGIVGILSFDDLVDALAVEMSDLARVIRQNRKHEAALTPVVAQPDAG
jgi:CBS domain-containing protein